ncbi:hypothetical protein HK102_004919, partial [Quaeritorhiza haematococci]
MANTSRTPSTPNSPIAQLSQLLPSQQSWPKAGKWGKQARRRRHPALGYGGKSARGEDGGDDANKVADSQRGDHWPFGDGETVSPASAKSRCLPRAYGRRVNSLSRGGSSDGALDWTGGDKDQAHHTDAPLSIEDLLSYLDGLLELLKTPDSASDTCDADDGERKLRLKGLSPSAVLIQAYLRILSQPEASDSAADEPDTTPFNAFLSPASTRTSTSTEISSATTLVGDEDTCTLGAEPVVKRSSWPSTNTQVSKTKSSRASRGSAAPTAEVRQRLKIVIPKPGQNGSRHHDAAAQTTPKPRPLPYFDPQDFDELQDDFLSSRLQRRLRRLSSATTLLSDEISHPHLPEHEQQETIDALHPFTRSNRQKVILELPGGTTVLRAGPTASVMPFHLDAPTTPTICVSPPSPPPMPVSSWEYQLQEHQLPTSKNGIPRYLRKSASATTLVNEECDHEHAEEPRHYAAPHRPATESA